MPIAVVRAETFYLPPPREPEDQWADVPAAELVYRYMEYRMQRRLVLPEEAVDETYWARINQNRWIADCICGSAQVVSPTDPRYGCVDCGWGWAAITFPEDVAAVEASVMGSAPSRRNWWNPNDPANPAQPPGPPPSTDPPTAMEVSGDVRPEDVGGR